MDRSAFGVSGKATFLVCVTLLGCGQDAHAQGFRGDNEEEAVSILQAFSANMGAFECFDMSLTERRHHVVPELNRGMESTLRRRYVCHFKDGVHLVIGTKREHSFALDSDKEDRRRRLEGIYVNAEKRQWWRLGTNGAVSLMDLPEKDADPFGRWALKWAGVSDPRHIGSNFFPSPFAGAYSFAELSRMSIGPPHQITLNEVAEENRVELVTVNQRYPGIRIRHLMDTARLVPTRMAFEVVPREGDAERTMTEKLSWEDLDGLMVPRQINGERLEKPDRDSDLRYPEFYDVVLTWHSVNRPDELPEVDESTLRDTQSLLRLLEDEAETPGTTRR